VDDSTLAFLLTSKLLPELVPLLLLTVPVVVVVCDPVAAADSKRCFLRSVSLALWIGRPSPSTATSPPPALE